MRSFLILCLIFLSSCSTLDKPKERLSVSLENARKLSFDSDNESSIKEKFGEPDKVVPAPQYGINVFIYNKKNMPYPLMSLVFNLKTQTLEGLEWSLSEEDPELKLENSMKLFPGAKFAFKDSEWKSHYKPALGYYFDDSKGVSINYNTAREEVSSISFYKPKLSESNKEHIPSKQ
jgi:hypothetical protein